MKHLRMMLFVVLLTVSARAYAADPAAAFNAANELYAKGQFTQAAAAYESLLTEGTVSANILFNDGNAEFKAGNPGKAIAAFRKAELMAPRDADIRANLAFVRSQAQGGQPPTAGSRFTEWLGQFTLNEWTVLTAVSFWLTLLLLAVRQVRPALAAKTKNAVYLLFMFTLFTAAATGLQATAHFSRQTAVVVQPQVNGLSGPFDDAQTAFTVRSGAELPVLDRHGDWIQVADRTGKIGWVGSKQVEVLPDA